MTTPEQFKAWLEAVKAECSNAIIVDHGIITPLALFRFYVAIGVGAPVLILGVRGEVLAAKDGIRLVAVPAQPLLEAAVKVERRCPWFIEED